MLGGVALSLCALSAAAQATTAEGVKQAAPKGGLPAMTPAKKISNAVPGAVTTPYTAFRLKLQASYCPLATAAAEKDSLTCKAYEIAQKMKAAKSEEEKKVLTADRLKLFYDSGKRSEEDKKAAAVAAKALYTKMFAGYCTGSKAAEALCTNELMKKLYGGPKTHASSTAAASKPAA